MMVSTMRIVITSSMLTMSLEWIRDTSMKFTVKTNGRYLILDILGQGTFAQVVKCQNMKSMEVVAVKVVKNKPAYFNQGTMEVSILELVPSSNPSQTCR